jgi:uncharacterized protein YjiS (DUF1127 family)
MAEISLRPGEALRIESGSGLTLVLRPHGEGWEVKVVNPWWKRWLRAWHEERQARLLAELDERILRDIGLHAASENSLTARVEAYRQQDLRRITMSRLGLM